MKKRFLSLAAIAGSLVLGVACSACSFGGRNTNDDIGELTERRGKITVWWPGSKTEMAAINKAKADYTALYPDVEIEVIGQQTADFYKAYTLACAGNSAPDIAYVDHVYVQSLAHYSYIANLSSAGFEDLESKFIDTLWEPGFYNDKLYALPMSANVLVTAYNKTLVAEAQGVTTDNITLPTDYDSFVALAEKISALNAGGDKNNPKYALTIPAGTNNDSMASMSYLAYVNRCGGAGILSEDLKTSRLNSPECIEAAKKIYNLGKYSPDVFSEAVFEKGNIGFIEMGPWKIEDYKKYSAQYGWEVGYTTAIPVTAGGNAGSTIGLYELVVTNKQSDKNKMALAADFVKFMTTADEYQLAFATPQNLIATTKTAVENEFYASAEWQVFIKQLENVVVRPGSPAWAEIEQTLGGFVTKLVQRKYGSEAEVEQNCVAIGSDIQYALDDIYG